MFQELYPEDKVSYESYRSIFNTHYNIAFGYPRCDTCSTCDEYNVNLRALTQSLESSEDKQSIENEITLLKRKLDEIKIVFPVRGYSYMECDRNMALINQKAHIELPSEWADQIAVARSKPSPFIVEQCEQDLFRNWADYFKPMFKPKCPIPTRSIKEIRVHREKPKLIFHRDSYNGAWVSNVITNNRYKGPILQANEFTHPQKLYDSLLPISAAKYDDCIDLVKLTLIIFSPVPLNRKGRSPVAVAHGTPPLRINNAPIPWQHTYKYLGITLDRNLHFRDHIKRVRKTAIFYQSRLKGMLGRYSKLSLRNKRTLYLMCIRTVLTYASPVFAHAPKTLKKLQVLQNKFCRTATNAHWCVKKFSPPQGLRSTINP
ncbi:RNA-directed DNA polymerase from mobile element jockey [Eumeta japonica]|uniref:RNA-directed DNA polymerase from mobile element jockey n=1 Tax=Eumeta variegata TaxID=151549 RepID=A0A4C1WUS3_EUMVA|nr:RNA-directed DNA polymerase from mobile element jockey [Eumeta japonica]